MMIKNNYAKRALSAALIVMGTIGSIVAQELTEAELMDRTLPLFDYKYWGEYKYSDDISAIRPQKWIEKDHTIDGWDFSLPEDTKVSEKSLMTLTRVMSIDGRPKSIVGKYHFDANMTCELWINWRDIEPVEGEYRWDRVHDAVNEIKEAGYGVALRILTSAYSRQGLTERGYAPEWLETYNIPFISFEGTGEGQLAIGGGSVCYDPSHEEFHKRYMKLVDSFGKSGLPQILKAAYTGYASKSHGEEFIAPIGVDPDSQPIVIERLNKWAEIFKGMEYKVYMGGPSNYGFELGFGVRRGFVEMYWYTIPDTVAGQHVDEEGYLYVDEDAHVIKNETFNGDVNEEYDAQWATREGKFRFGLSTNSFPYRYFMSNLRALQMRCTSLVPSGNLIPEMVPYISQELARTVHNTPDIWSFMCESTIASHCFEGINHEGFSKETDRKLSDYERENGVVAKNFERWLYQRDREGYITEPAMKIQHAIKMKWTQKDKYYDYIARRGARIGFFADDRFDVGGVKKAIKVSYFDETKGKMELKYLDSKGREQSVSTKLKGDGELRTVTFIIDDISLSSSGDDFDFSLNAAGGAKDICVSMVRVVKM